MHLKGNFIEQKVVVVVGDFVVNVLKIVNACLFSNGDEDVSIFGHFCGLVAFGTKLYGFKVRVAFFGYEALKMLSS